ARMLLPRKMPRRLPRALTPRWNIWIKPTNGFPSWTNSKTWSATCPRLNCGSDTRPHRPCPHRSRPSLIPTRYVAETAFDKSKPADSNPYESGRYYRTSPALTAPRGRFAPPAQRLGPGAPPPLEWRHLLPF